MPALKMVRELTTSSIKIGVTMESELKQIKIVTITKINFSIGWTFTKLFE